MSTLFRHMSVTPFCVQYEQSTAAEHDEHDCVQFAWMLFVSADAASCTAAIATSATIAVCICALAVVFR